MSTITLDEIALPANLTWEDEFDWNPVSQKMTYTLSGSLVVESGVKQAGRPITLSGAWIKRSVLLAVQAKLLAPQQMVLTLPDGRTFNVIFRYHDSLPLVTEPVFELVNPPDTHLYLITLKLMEV